MFDRFATNLVHLAPRAVALATVLAVLPACDKSGGGSNAPGIVEGVGNDISNEVDGAGETANGVGDDVSGGANDVVDGASGSSDAPPAEDTPAEDGATEDEASRT